MRVYERRAAQSYREYKQAEAIRRTEELDARVTALQGLLTSGCRASAFLPSVLMCGKEPQSLVEVMDGVARREPDAVVDAVSIGPGPWRSSPRSRRRRDRDRRARRP